VVKPSSLLNFHRALVQRKYRLLFSAKRRTRPGPKGPSADLIRAIVEMKQRNPRWGCPRIAGQLALAFGIDINKDVVRRILAAHYVPSADHSGPSWLTFLGHAKDSLHSIDLFRCESVALRTYWVLVVMDQYTRRIIGFGVHRGIVDGVELCRMFKLPFVERLIGTIRREYLDVALFWTAVDLESKLSEFRDYYNLHRSHAGRAGKTPEEPPEVNACATLQSYRWRGHCRGLFHTPIAA
jgi:transposase InsO family protein